MPECLIETCESHDIPCELRSFEVCVGMATSVCVFLCLCFCVCVCVARLNRRKTSKQGATAWGSIQSMANEITVYFLCKRTCVDRHGQWRLQLGIQIYMYIIVSMYVYKYIYILFFG